MFWKVILMFQSIWWLLPLFEFWNISWHSSLKRDAKLWYTQVIVSYPGRSCSSNKPVGGADNKQTDVVRNKPEKTAYISRRHHWFHQEITWRTLKRSNSPYAWLRQTSKFHQQASFVNKIFCICTFCAWVFFSTLLPWEFISVKLRLFLISKRGLVVKFACVT